MGRGEVYEVEADSASEREWEDWEGEFGGWEGVRAFEFGPPSSISGGSGSATSTFGHGYGHGFLGRRGSVPAVLGEEEYVAPGRRDRSATIGPSGTSASGATGMGVMEGSGLVDVEEEVGTSPRSRSKSVTVTGASANVTPRGGDEGRNATESQRLRGTMVNAPYYLTGHIG